MGSFCDLSLGNGGRSGSSRRGKKSSSDKPKQPQRGLGVAQLEKIRLQSEMVGSFQYPSFQSPFQGGTNNNNKEMIAQMSFASSQTSPSTTGGSSSLFSHPNCTMDYRESAVNEIRYGAFPSSTAIGSFSDADEIILRPYHFAQSNESTLPLLPQVVQEDSLGKRGQNQSHYYSVGSTHDHSDYSGDLQELDLELRL